MILIISLDSDKKLQKALEIMIKQIIPLAKYESFSSVHECYECLKKKDVTVALLSKEIGKNILDYQIIISEMKTIQPDVNIILVGEKPLDNATAFWNMKNHVVDYIQKPVTLEKLKNALQFIDCS